MSAIERIQQWQQRGQLVSIGKREIFVVDVSPAPASDSTGSDTPLLVLHGFPTSSIDFDAVLACAQAGRRVVLFDFLGFGHVGQTRPPLLAAHPGRRGRRRAWPRLGIERVDLLTHDMGDSVGGELLARSKPAPSASRSRRGCWATAASTSTWPSSPTGSSSCSRLPDDAWP